MEVDYKDWRLVQEQVDILVTTQGTLINDGESSGEYYNFKQLR